MANNSDKNTELTMSVPKGGRLLLKGTRCETVFVFSPRSSRHLFRNASALNPALRYQRIGHDETPLKAPQGMFSQP